MAEEVKHLFVYGTLMRGQANHNHFCADTLTIEPAVTTGHLYHLPTGYPAMIEADDGQVFGQAMTFRDLDAALRRIDHLEGYDPQRLDSSMYIRVTRTVRLLRRGNWVPAYTYLWNQALPRGAKDIASRWR